jgi:hypothetical protein
MPPSRVSIDIKMAEMRLELVVSKKLHTRVWDNAKDTRNYASIKPAEATCAISLANAIGYSGELGTAGEACLCNVERIGGNDVDKAAKTAGYHAAKVAQWLARHGKSVDEEIIAHKKNPFVRHDAHAVGEIALPEATDSIFCDNAMYNRRQWRELAAAGKLVGWPVKVKKKKKNTKTQTQANVLINSTWDKILVRSMGATAVLETIPAMAPHRKDLAAVASPDQGWSAAIVCCDS